MAVLFSHYTLSSKAMDVFFFLIVLLLFCCVCRSNSMWIPLPFVSSCKTDYFLCSFILSTSVESLVYVRNCAKLYISQVTFWVRSWISVSLIGVPALSIETEPSGHEVCVVWYSPASFYLSEQWTSWGTGGRERNHSFQIQARWSQSLTRAWLDSFWFLTHFDITFYLFVRFCLK